MFSVAPNIVLAPNMTQNAERKHRTQDANTAPIRPRLWAANGLDESPITFTSWMVIGMPLAVINLFIVWIWLEVYFLGFR